MILGFILWLLQKLFKSVRRYFARRKQGDLEDNSIQIMDRPPVRDRLAAAMGDGRWSFSPIESVESLQRPMSTYYNRGKGS